MQFRKRGHKPAPLPQPIGSDEFWQAYNAALGVKIEIGKAKREQEFIAASQGPGVYLLLLAGEIVYVGSSLGMGERVEQHRNYHRPFDQVFFIPTTKEERAALERILIKAIKPKQNGAGK